MKSSQHLSTRRDRAVASVFIVAALLACWASAAHAASEELSFAHGDPFYALSRGANVYLCNLADWTQIGTFHASLIWGSVRLDVRQTIRGPSRKSMRLGCCFATGAFKKDLGVWVDPDQLRGKTLLCVILPRALPIAPQNIPGVDGTASDVTVVDGDRDAVIAGYREISRLHDIADRQTLVRELGEAVLDPRDLVRGYAMEAAAVRLIPMDPDTATSIVLRRFSKEREMPCVEGEAERLAFELRLLSIRLHNRAGLARALCAWAANGPDGVAKEAVALLSECIARKELGTPRQVLRPADRTNFETKVRQLLREEGPTGTAQQVLAWLLGGDTYGRAHDEGPASGKAPRYTEPIAHDGAGAQGSVVLLYRSNENQPEA